MIPDKALDAAQEAAYPLDIFLNGSDVEKILEAAAPFIRAEALRDAANEFGFDETTTGGENVNKFLTDWADDLEGK